MRRMKYIIFEERYTDVCVVFSECIEHRDFAAIFPPTFKPKSAGFVVIHNGEICCFGKSIGLDLESNPVHDTAILRKQLGMI